VPKNIALDSRKIYPAGWGLLGQWFCIPADATEEEQVAAAERIKESMGPDFARCPNKWIVDRFYGGFPCRDDPSRVHVYFASGQYSFIAAQEGRFWENNASSRRNMWADLLQANEGEWQEVGPWIEDVPKDLL
jgi:hypothetical protein